MYEALIKPAVKDLYHFILDTLFPIYCLICEKEDIKFICDVCKNKLTKLEHQHCIVCKKPSPGGLTHPICKTPHMPEGLISIFNYHDKKVADILIKGKYKFLPEVYEVLGKMIVDDIKNKFPDVLHGITYDQEVMVIPLPLHKRRLRWRGFNQSEVLAKTVSDVLLIPYDDLLIRGKPTKTQKDLKKEQRIKNVKDAFKIKFPPKIGGVAGQESGQGGITIKDKNVILIDDVVTTGSTLLEAAKVLKRSGAKEVWCLTVARD
ncbi:MAG: hypothetical protein COT92_00740 [Candidatus Doudnabacteria bacterium CG10_big_fil_rev_8_21_14_0_10_42_18]|uniref:Phosphoribosyltransferase domain-containing protein n=1 Tax=Candidatus Doudnabacteria bacterium CG10_big_fil_rev_8_21_14_0_10_42_18 TaxID=1974552 RepID=A0A2H0VBK3_9BACT|nr:MAG: hypothetical protein COT92_00740 [Candidatus Doudnabacteria bacterium CG10_big_fil_rev_8_21_14_0_10_42_18]